MLTPNCVPTHFRAPAKEDLLEVILARVRQRKAEKEAAAGASAEEKAAAAAAKRSADMAALAAAAANPFARGAKVPRA